MTRASGQKPQADSLREPPLLVLTSGLMQALMLPRLAGAALYFRYRRGDARIRPGKRWDFFLWISGAGMFLAGLWAAWESLFPYLQALW